MKLFLVDKDFKSKILEWGYREKKTIKFDIISETKKHRGVALFGKFDPRRQRIIARNGGTVKKQPNKGQPKLLVAF